jgi:hypothetical protein
VTPNIQDRLIPPPRGFDDHVKAKAAQAERTWEAATGSLTFVGLGGGAAMAAGLAIPPIAPFVAAVAAGRFYFKLRAKWAKEDPPRSDYEDTTPFRPPRLDLMVLMPRGPVPEGVAIASLLHAAAASVKATVVAVERAMGASLAAQEASDGPDIAFAARMREARQHANRSAALTAGVRAAADAIGPFLEKQLREFRQQLPPTAQSKHRVRIADTLDDRALGHVIAAGIDERLLDVGVWWDEETHTERLSKVLLNAGDAAEQFGGSLARWAQDTSFGGPGTSEPT